MPPKDAKDIQEWPPKARLQSTNSPQTGLQQLAAIDSFRCLVSKEGVLKWYPKWYPKWCVGKEPTVVILEILIACPNSGTMCNKQSINNVATT